MSQHPTLWLGLSVLAILLVVVWGMVKCVGVSHGHWSQGTQTCRVCRDGEHHHAGRCPNDVGFAGRCGCWVPDHAYRPASVAGYCVCGVPLRYHGADGDSPR